MPRRIQRRREQGWRMPEGAVYVGRPTKWGNPFGFRSPSGLVRYREEAPEQWDYEGRISADGMRHPYYGPDGTVVDFWVRYATHAELVQMYRRTLLDPMPGMKSAYPSRGGHFLKVAAADVRAELAGRDLVCWCPVWQACHADVLLAVANEETEWIAADSLAERTADAADRGEDQ